MLPINILVEKLKEVEPEANKNMVVKKINSLRTCFRKELKKYKSSWKTGTGTEDVYKPNLWYFDQLIFLSDQETPRQGNDTLSENIIAGSDSEDVQEDSIRDDRNKQSELSNNSDSLSTTPSSSRPTSRTTMVDSKKKKRDRCDDVLDIIADSLQSNAAVQIEPVGKYSSYGKYIAQELEDLPPTMAIYCKKIINEAIYYAQLGSLSSQSKVVTSSQTTTYLQPMGSTSRPPHVEPLSYNHNTTLTNY